MLLALLMTGAASTQKCCSAKHGISPWFDYLGHELTLITYRKEN